MKQLADAAPGFGGASRKEFVNRVAKKGGLVGNARPAIQVHHQGQWHMARKAAAPAHDELLGLRVEIPLVER